MATTEKNVTPTDPDKATSAIAIRPLDTIGSVGTLRALLEPRLGSLAAVLPKHVTPDRLMKTLLIAVNRTPDLLLCTQESMLEAISRSAELGLDISGTLGEAWLLPFNNKIKWIAPDGSKQEKWALQATFMPGYRGLVKLMRQSGEVSKVEADVVHEADEFEFERGLNPKLRHVPNFKVEDRGKVLGAYAVFVFRNGDAQMDFMTVAEIEKVRKKSKQPNGQLWTEHWNEAAKKTVIRRAVKLAPMSAEKVNLAIQAADAEFEFPDDVVSPTRATAPDLSTIEGKEEASAKLEAVQPVGEKKPEPITFAEEPATGGAQAEKKTIGVDAALALKEAAKAKGIAPKAITEHTMTTWGVEFVSDLSAAQAKDLEAWIVGWKAGK